LDNCTACREGTIDNYCMYVVHALQIADTYSVPHKKAIYYKFSGCAHHSGYPRSISINPLMHTDFGLLLADLVLTTVSNNCARLVPRELAVR